jgi:hypothetical protein
VRDEDYFLPFFFNHYRNIGFEDFLVYADRCLAPTMDFLAAQPDATVLTGDYTFGQTFGNDLRGKPRKLGAFLKESLSELLPARWVFVADADEFLILPPPAGDIYHLITVLERANQPYATAPMVDMYPQCLALRNHPTTFSPFDICIFFDEGPYYFWKPAEISAKSFRVGVRQRLLQLLAQRFPSELMSLYGSKPVYAPIGFKVPLLKHGAGIRRIGDHRINVGPSTANAVALAHFKFSPGLDDKIATAINEEQYFEGSFEYKVLALATGKLPYVPLVGPRSRQFTGADSYVAASLLSPLN